MSQFRCLPEAPTGADISAGDRQTEGRTGPVTVPGELVRDVTPYLLVGRRWYGPTAAFFCIGKYVRKFR